MNREKDNTKRREAIPSTQEEAEVRIPYAKTHN